MGLKPAPVTDITGARILGLFLDSITTDHISPAGAIKRDSPAGRYLIEHGVEVHDFNSYGARRGNHEVMVRGTFANTRIKNQMVPGVEGGVTIRRASAWRSTMRPCATKKRRCPSSSSPERNTAPGRRAIGRRRARFCSASAP
jgi:aconitate hydratase